MLRRVVGIACALSLVAGAALAGDAAKDKAAAEKAMQEAMMNCAICKHMAANMETLGSSMTSEIATLNDGMAFIHVVNDPTKAATLHTMMGEMSKAGEMCMNMSEAEAKKQLCEFCGEIVSTMRAGAKMSHGSSKMSEIMVLTSADPVVKARIDAIAAKCAMMDMEMSKH
jgi:hypothetical protein